MQEEIEDRTKKMSIPANELMKPNSKPAPQQQHVQQPIQPPVHPILIENLDDKVF